MSIQAIKLNFKQRSVFNRILNSSHEKHPKFVRRIYRNDLSLGDKFRADFLVGNGFVKEESGMWSGETYYSVLKGSEGS